MVVREGGAGEPRAYTLPDTDPTPPHPLLLLQDEAALHPLPDSLGPKVKHPHCHG